MPIYEYTCNYCDEPFEVQATLHWLLRTQTIKKGG